MAWRTAPETRLAATTSRPINDGRSRPEGEEALRGAKG